MKRSELGDLTALSRGGRGTQLHPRRVTPTDAGERLVETLRPALDGIDAKLAALIELREKPAGTIPITASPHPAETLLWPIIEGLLCDYPDIKIEISLDSTFADIVAACFDAGVRSR